MFEASKQHNYGSQKWANYAFWHPNSRVFGGVVWSNCQPLVDQQPIGEGPAGFYIWWPCIYSITVEGWVFVKCQDFCFTRGRPRLCHLSRLRPYIQLAGPPVVYMMPLLAVPEDEEVSSDDGSLPETSEWSSSSSDSEAEVTAYATESQIAMRFLHPNYYISKGRKGWGCGSDTTSTSAPRSTASASSWISASNSGPSDCSWPASSETSAWNSEPSDSSWAVLSVAPSNISWQDRLRDFEEVTIAEGNEEILEF